MFAGGEYSEGAEFCVTSHAALKCEGGKWSRDAQLDCTAGMSEMPKSGSRLMMTLDQWGLTKWGLTTWRRTSSFRFFAIWSLVLGVVGEDRCIGAPPAGAKGQRFLISVNSEEARAAELGTKSKWMLGLGVACLIGAVACLGSAFWLALTGREAHRDFRKPAHRPQPYDSASRRAEALDVKYSPRRRTPRWSRQRGRHPAISIDADAFMPSICSSPGNSHPPGHLPLWASP